MAVSNKSLALAIVALTLAGCASTYNLTLMPRNSGKLYYGQAVEQSTEGQATISVTIEGKTYRGDWVPLSAARTSTVVTGAVGWGGRRGGMIAGAPVVLENPEGAAAKALLQAPDGSGLRCDLRGLGSGTTAGGTCLDDAGMIYDVQMRAVKKGG